MKVRFKLLVVLLTFTIVLLPQFTFSALNISGLWDPTFSRSIPGKSGPSIIALEGGTLLYLANDGALFTLTMAGGTIQQGQFNQVVNIVAPPVFIKPISGSTRYVIYVTAQGTAQNRLVVHSFTQGSPGGNATATNIDGPSYGLTAYLNSGQIVIFLGTVNGTLYRITYDTVNNSFVTPPITVNLGQPIKTPPMLNPGRTRVYVLTQNGKFSIRSENNLTEVSSITLGGEFTTPMAMSSSGHVYALSNQGTLYKIDPSTSPSEQHVKFLSAANSSGPLIDGDDIIYVFGDNGKVVALNSSLTKAGEFSIGQQITSTPGIVKGLDGITYLIVPSSSYGNGKVSILSYNLTSGQFNLVWQYNIPSSIPISGAVNIAPLGALMSENYYFTVAANDGTVYAWQFDARGPYGIWAKYGQNSFNTGFIDRTSIGFSSRIYLIAREGYYGKELSSSLLSGSISSPVYGLLYDATIVNDDNSPPTVFRNLRTNETNPASILQGIPGVQSAVVEFSTPTTARLLLGRYVNVRGVSTQPTKDSTFTFRFWRTGAPNNYEGAQGDNPATLTFRFNDRRVELYTDASYTYFIYHRYPLSANSEGTTVVNTTFNYGEFINNPNNAKVTINSSPVQGGQVFYAYKWNVYQWNPDASTGYDRQTYYYKDSIQLPLKGPGYVEIFYAQLNATVTLLVPEFAYGPTKAFLFLDAATNSVAEAMRLETKLGVTINRIEFENYSANVTKVDSLSRVSPNKLEIVLQNFNPPLSGTTRVATIALNLMFPDKATFTGSASDPYEQYFDLYGYAQLQGGMVDPDYLTAKRVYKAGKFLYILGDFDNDLDVDINDWNMFVTRLGTTVTGMEMVFNIGPRQDYTPPYPNVYSYKVGYLTDSTNNVDASDLYIFTTMFGFAIAPADVFQ